MPMRGEWRCRRPSSERSEQATAHLPGGPGVRALASAVSMLCND